MEENRPVGSEDIETRPDPSLLMPWYNTFKAANRTLAGAAEFVIGIGIAQAVFWVLTKVFVIEIPQWVRWLVYLLTGLSVAIYSVVDFVASTWTAYRRFVATIRERTQEISEKHRQHMALREQLDDPNCTLRKDDATDSRE